MKLYQYLTVPYLTVPYLTVPYLTVPYRTVPYRTVPYRTVPYRTVPYVRSSDQLLQHGTLVMLCGLPSWLGGNFCRS